jgi:hypothetical protein
MIEEQEMPDTLVDTDTHEQRIAKLEQRMDELEQRQYEFMGILRDVVDEVKRQHDTLDAVIEAEGAAKSKS